ncbi:hypothetical protein PCAR4_250029 [Paraburkholderia caribensis]|nr:hypothetical protein PCAR4_250029 [Paraburkholderia caribensis]
MHVCAEVQTDAKADRPFIASEKLCSATTVDAVLDLPRAYVDGPIFDKNVVPVGRGSEVRRTGLRPYDVEQEPRAIA